MSETILAILLFGTPIISANLTMASAFILLSVWQNAVRVFPCYVMSHEVTSAHKH